MLGPNYIINTYRCAKIINLKLKLSIFEMFNNNREQFTNTILTEGITTIFSFSRSVIAKEDFLSVPLHPYIHIAMGMISFFNIKFHIVSYILYLLCCHG